MLLHRLARHIHCTVSLGKADMHSLRLGCATQSALPDLCRSPFTCPSSLLSVPLWAARCRTCAQVRDTFRARSKIVSTLRRELEDQGFLEVRPCGVCRAVGTSGGSHGSGLQSCGLLELQCGCVKGVVWEQRGTPSSLGTGQGNPMQLGRGAANVWLRACAGVCI